jgi:hypothetical protein
MATVLSFFVVIVFPVGESHRELRRAACQQ